jgi:dihydroorotase
MSAKWATRALIMPNLKPPVTTTEMALAYRQRIMDALPADTSFQPLMTLYLTDHTSPDEIRKAMATGKIVACKLYPAGATTNSASGVTDVFALLPVFKVMEELGMVLCIHGEVVDPTVDFFAREAVFVAEKLSVLLPQIPNLKVVLEHATTREAVEFVRYFMIRTEAVTEIPLRCYLFFLRFLS